MKKPMKSLWCSVVGAASVWLSGVVWAGQSLVWELTDQQSQPLPDVVVVLASESGEYPAVPSGTQAVMDQVKRQFDPHVLAIQQGTLVSFPNSDDILHHVYSFSTPKPFELELYHGKPSQPVLFDKPGVVVLGCNIHDQMLGYIYISASPWQAVSDAQGRAQLQNVPPGKYQVTLWHPHATEAIDTAELVVPEEGDPAVQRLALSVTQPQSTQEQPGSGLFRQRGFMSR